MKELDSRWKWAAGVLLVLSTCAVGCYEEGAGAGCDPTCICDGLPGRPFGACSECNPAGEVILNQVQCPASVAIGGVCQYELSSANSVALALELTIFTIRPPAGTILAPTVSNLPATPVALTLRRLNDGATQTFIYSVQDSCF